MAVFILDKVSKTYSVEKTKVNVLKDIDIVFPDKGLVSIEGKSGSGKSTLLNILMGIEKPTSGRVLFQRNDISKYSDKHFSNYHLNQISLVFQHYNLFEDLTAFENVIIQLKMRGENRKRINEKANLLFKQFGLEKLARRKVKKLSGGEKQRISIMRALITDPKAILCDEPTGALDSKNSIEIMNILKKISEKTLVILVSHNIELVNKYSDQILILKDGKIEENTTNITERFTNNFNNKKYKYSSKWATLFLFKNLFKNYKKNLFSLVSTIIAFISVYISIGFLIGSRDSENEALLRNLQVSYATVSEIVNVEIDNSPLVYTKQTKPDLIKVDEVIGQLESIRCEENINYFISSYPTFEYNGSIYNDFSMIPIYDLSLNSFGSEMLIDGRPGSNEFREILVNIQFSKRYGVNANDEIKISNSSLVKYSTGDNEKPFVKDEFIINDIFKIVGIVDEFDFLNSPKIYFSYIGAKNLLSSTIMENISSYKNEQISFYKYLSMCSNDDLIASYSSILFVTDKKEINNFFNLISNNKNEGIEITSNALDIKNAYSSFINSFSTALIVFVIIAFIGVNLILAMLSLSSFLENKKETAIMTCLGGRNGSLYSIYLNENMLIIVMSILLSTILVSKVANKLNDYLFDKFSLSSLIKIPISNFHNIPYLLPLSLLIIGLFFSYIFTKVPMFLYRHNSIADELRDE